MRNLIKKAIYNRYSVSTFLILTVIIVSFLFNNDVFSATSKLSTEEMLIVEHNLDSYSNGLPNTIKYFGKTKVEFLDAHGIELCKLTVLDSDGEERQLQYNVEVFSVEDVALFKKAKEVAVYSVVEEDGTRKNYLVVEGNIYKYSTEY